MIDPAAVKNWAVTILCFVTAIVLVAGYYRLDRTLTLAEARLDAVYSIAVATEQRNRTAVDESVKAGAEITALVRNVNETVVPRAARLLTTASAATEEIATQTKSFGQSSTKLVAVSTDALQQLSGEASLTTANLNQTLGQTSASVNEILTQVASRVGDDRIDQVADSLVATSSHVSDSSLHLANTLEQLQGVSVDLKNTSAHAPAIADSVDKIFRQQKKWSTLFLILRAVSLVR